MIRRKIAVIRRENQFIRREFGVYALFKGEIEGRLRASPLRNGNLSNSKNDHQCCRYDGKQAANAESDCGAE